MDCAVIYSEAALTDLEQITAFIARDNPDVAQRFANRLVDLAESLRSLPERGRPVNDFLSFRKSANTVEILRFWHGARDPLSLEL